jgi:hypothetical protein
VTEDIQDCHDIERLMHLYAHRIDAADFDAFAALFEHGTLHLRGLAPPATGTAEVRDLVGQVVILHDGSPRTNHVIANILIDVADDRLSATARSYVQVLHGLAGNPIATIATAFYDDRFVRVDGQWWFESRAATASLVGDMSTHVRRGTTPGGTVAP